ncbi:Dabb family protein [Nocardia sienata]|uniref:Dabb family protein n=1 Tax=Nocardia sienata TaxID=248552 RepID=UPI0007A525BD|nr:Dabb family protein [Nocardia sienata]
MIVNVLRFSFRDGVSEAEEALVLDTMRRTAGVESVLFGCVGRDIGDPRDGFTHAYTAAVADLAALERYLHDPVHLSGDPRIFPYIARLSAVRFSDDPDPDLTAKVEELHLQKVRTYPEWGRMLAEVVDGTIATEVRS